MAKTIAGSWLDCALWGSMPSATDEIESWLDRQDVVVSVSTWTDLARRCAHHQSNHHTALRCAARAAECIEASHSDAGQAADSFVALARAVLPIAHAEAKAYFDTAVGRLDRLGDEIHEKLWCLLALAEHAARGGQTEPRQAYRLARVAELLYEYNDHKFPWQDVADAVAGLSPSSALAIVSRWRDRERCDLDETLPAVVLRLLQDGRLDGSAAAALYAFGGYWNLSAHAELLLAHEPHLGRRERALAMVARDLEIEGCGKEAAAELLAAARRHGLNHERLRDLVEFGRQNDEQAESACSGTSEPRFAARPQPEPDWPAIIGAEDFATPSGIDAAVTRMLAGEHRWRWNELFDRMRQAVPVARWADHVAALGHASKLSTDLVLDAVAAASAAWPASAAVAAKVRRVALASVGDAPLDFVESRWAIRRLVTKVAELSGCSRDEIVGRIARSVADHVDQIDIGGMLGLAEAVVDTLGPADASDALDYALDRLEPNLKDTDADGPWRPDLMPPADVPNAVAGLLYASLGSPKAEHRWRATHALRRFCQLGQSDVVSSVVGLLNIEPPAAFTDATLPFYPLHARLYALIAFARAADEVPALLRPHAYTFARLALADLPHVLIRGFAAKVVLLLEAAYPGTVTDETLGQLRVVNTSQYPAIAPQRDKVTGWDNLQSSKTRFTFGYDMERYWFGPLAQVFDLPSIEIERRIDAWIIDRWATPSKGWWKEDRRAELGQYDRRGAFASHGQYPRIDTHAFYLSYHAMFCVAGDLLAELPTVMPQDWGVADTWEDWLARHHLTRRDGRWLADRRDLPPFERRRWQRQGSMAHDENWRWSVLPEDFDDALGVAGASPQRIAVRGHWTHEEGGKREELSVASALVTPRTASALLRALQTADSHFDFGIPDHGERLEIRRPGFRLTGWLTSPERDYGLDQFDPFAGKLPWPLPQPAPLFTRLCGLVPVDDGRRWHGSKSPTPAASISILAWGDHNDGNRRRGGSRGVHVEADLQQLLAALQVLHRDMIFKVSIRREDGRELEEKDYRHGTSFRLYLLTSDGDLRTLRGHRRVGTEACSGAGA